MQPSLSLSITTIIQGEEVIVEDTGRYSASGLGRLLNRMAKAGANLNHLIHWTFLRVISHAFRQSYR